MKALLLLLCVGISYSAGFSIRKIKTNPDTYEVEENDKSTVKLVHPESGLPTLREIVYFHVVERPYEDIQTHRAHKEDAEGPDFDDSRRHFTNGHGYQFLDVHPEKTEQFEASDSSSSEEWVSGSEETGIATKDYNGDDEDNEGTGIATEDHNGDDKDKETTASEENNVQTDLDDEDTVTGDEQANNDDEKVKETEFSDDEDEFKDEFEDTTGSMTHDDVENPNCTAQGENDGSENTGDDSNLESVESEDKSIKNDDTNAIIDENGPKTNIAVQELASTANDSLQSGNDEDENVQIDKRIKDTPQKTNVDKAPEKQQLTENDIEEKKKARNQLFEDLRQRYQKEDQSKYKVLSRHKRSPKLQKIPEPPKLPELDYETLPEDVRRIISTESPLRKSEPELTDLNDDEYTSTSDDSDDHTSDEIQKQIADKIQDIMAHIMVGDDDDNSDADDDDDVNSDETVEPRTYGMKLNGQGGFVWNDLWSNPGISFNVGEQQATQTDSFIFEPYESVESTESIESELDELFIPPNLNDLADIHPTDDNEDDIFINFNDKKKVFEENKHKNGEKHNDSHAEASNIDKFDDAKRIKTEKVKFSYEKTDESQVKNKKTDARDGKEPTSLEIESKHESKEETDSGADGDLPIKVWEELFNNKKFWKWLEQWTSLYMEQLFKHIKSMIRDEVSKQIKNYDDMFRRRNMDEDIPIDKRKDEIKDKHSKKKDKKNKNKDVEIVPSKDSDDLETNDKLPGPVIKDGKIYIDGKEIPLTHNTNFYKDKKHKHEINKSKNPSSLPVKANTTEKVNVDKIFGNSLGNKEVTNIYIFYPNKDVGSVIDDLKHSDKIHKPHKNSSNEKEKDEKINQDKSNNTNEIETKPSTNDKEANNDKNKGDKDKKTDEIQSQKDEVTDAKKDSTSNDKKDASIENDKESKDKLQKVDESSKKDSKVNVSEDNKTDKEKTEELNSNKEEIKKDSSEVKDDQVEQESGGSKFSDDSKEKALIPEHGKDTKVSEPTKEVEAEKTKAGDNKTIDKEEKEQDIDSTKTKDENEENKE